MFASKELKIFIIGVLSGLVGNYIYDRWIA